MGNRDAQTSLGQAIRRRADGCPSTGITSADRQAVHVLDASTDPGPTIPALKDDRSAGGTVPGRTLGRLRAVGFKSL